MPGRAESLLEDWCTSRNVDRVILRVSGIYGPGRLGIDRLERGAPVLRDEDSGPGNRIHVDDLVECCVAALRKNDAPPGVYNVADGDHRSSAAFSGAVARLAGLPEPPEITRAQAERTFSEMRLSFLNESRRIDTTKMREVLGVVPRYADPGDGIRASLEEERRG